MIAKPDAKVVISGALRKFFSDDGTFLARGLAFGLLFYFVPFALLTVSALSYTVASSDTALLWVQRFSQAFVPHSHDVFDNVVTAIVAKRGLLGAFGFAAFVIASSTTFGSVRLVLNRIFRAPEPRGIIHGKVMEIVMMIATSLLFFIVIGSVYLINLVETIILSFRFLTFLNSGFAIAGYAISILSTFGLFWYLYRFTPAETLTRRGLIVASMTATVLFEISKSIFGLYLRYAQGTTAIYGALSALVFFLLWLYYACVIFVFAAELGWTFDKENNAAFAAQS